MSSRLIIIHIHSELCNLSKYQTDNPQLLKSFYLFFYFLVHKNSISDEGKISLSPTKEGIIIHTLRNPSERKVILGRFPFTCLDLSDSQRMIKKSEFTLLTHSDRSVKICIPFSFLTEYTISNS